MDTEVKQSAKQRSDQWRKEARERRKAFRKEEKLSAYTNGHADYTPFTAITGKEKMSKPTLTNPVKRVGGSFNG